MAITRLAQIVVRKRWATPWHKGTNGFWQRWYYTADGTLVCDRGPRLTPPTWAERMARASEATTQLGRALRTGA